MIFSRDIVYNIEWYEKYYTKHLARETYANVIQIIGLGQEEMMVPKKFFSENRQVLDQNYIFGLMTEECNDRFNDLIKKQIEAIAEGITYESSLDINDPGELDLMNRLWKSIQRAGIIIADISGFHPNIMYELGVALTIKEHVIIICDEEKKSLKDTPFDISHLSILFYNSNNMAELGTKLVQSIFEILRGISRVFDAKLYQTKEAANLLKTVKSLRKKEEWASALVLLERMNVLEPDNFEIYMQWGKTLKCKGDFKIAFNMFEKASRLAEANFQRSQIFTEIALLCERAGRDADTLNFFRKAEEADNTNYKLYRCWALYYIHKEEYDEAMQKMSQALRIYGNIKKKDKNSKKPDLNLKKDEATLEFIIKKVLDPSFPITLQDFLESKAKLFCKVPPPPLPKLNVGEVFDGTIQNVHLNFGLFVDITNKGSGLILRRFLPDDYSLKYKKGDAIKVEVLNVKANGKVELKFPEKLSKSSEESTTHFVHGVKIYYDKKLLKSPIVGVLKDGNEKEEDNWENITELYAQVMDINDDNGIIRLNCKEKVDSEETFDRVFPLKHFKNNDKLVVDQSILVKVYERPGEVRFMFEESDEDFFKEDHEDEAIGFEEDDQPSK